jgi:hypothetical protein
MGVIRQSAVRRWLAPVAGSVSVVEVTPDHQSREGTQGESFPALMERRATAGEFFEWFRAFDQPKKLRVADWTEQVLPVLCAVGDFSWMKSRDRSWVQNCILDFARKAFTKLWSPAEHRSSELREALGRFVRWVELLPDQLVVQFCWDLLAYKRSSTPEPVWWLKRSGRLHGAISYDNLSLAVSLADESDAMYWWPDERWEVAVWGRDSAPYLDLLNHASYLVRAAAGKTLGALFYGARTKGQAKNAPALADILALVQAKEIVTSGVAGPFLHGANWSVAPEEWSSFGAGVDMRGWFVETLTRSARELDVPHIQSLEFYAHELFSFDDRAIRQFMKMGRTELAVMTATEEPGAIDKLLPLLNELAASDHHAVSAAIREYLLVRSHHAGLHHVTPD